MKITRMEERESYKAHRRKMCCINCGSPFYTVHHSYVPENKKYGEWWVSCDDCDYEGYRAETKEKALVLWRDEE